MKLLPFALMLSFAGSGAAPFQETPPLRIPDRHPYLALTPDSIARARERIHRLPWARHTFDAVVRQADAALSSDPLPLPAPGKNRHYTLSEQLLQCGLAASFTGERRYAEWAAKLLLAYADLYRSLPDTWNHAKIQPRSSLMEATWIVPVIQAYDLVADSGVLTNEQRRRIETDLLHASLPCFKIDDFKTDYRSRNLHYKCYNFQAWHLSAIGLVGLAVRDPSLVDYALHSPYGFRHLVGHDIRDDGIFWERSIGYHHFVLAALFPFTEAMMNCGVDLYSLEVPTLRDRDEDANYMNDRSRSPKTLRMMFDSFFYALFPDSGRMALGDDGFEPYRATWLNLVAWHRTRDPKLAWLLRRDVPLDTQESDRGRVGFFHYYRYHYRYENVLLDGRPVRWGRIDETFRPDGDALVAHDGGRSQPDRFLLNDADLSDGTLEWTMTRLENLGSEERAWLVFHLHTANDRNRKLFGLGLPEVGRPYRFKLVVTAGQAALFRDGVPLPDRPNVQRHSLDWRWLAYDAPQLLPGGGPEWRWTDASFANTGVFRNGCTLYPSSGFAVLREAGADFLSRPDATAAGLSYGPYGGGHGHPDKLSIVVASHGHQWIPHFGSMPYDHPLKAQWTAHTISHNTVVIDGISQKPTRTKNIEWPVDDDRNKVIGRLERFDPDRKLVHASTRHAYSDARLHRTLRLVRHAVLDVYDVRFVRLSNSDPHRRVDYILHLNGAFQQTTATLEARAGKLGERCGYQHVEQKQGGMLDGTSSFTFVSGDRAFRIWVLPDPEHVTEAIVADGLGYGPDSRIPMLILRQKARQTRFLSVFEPVDPSNPLRSVRQEPGKVILTWSSGEDCVEWD